MKNMVGYANNLDQKLSTNKQVPGLRNTFQNNSFFYIELSIAQRYRTIHTAGFLGNLLRPLIECNLPLMKTCDPTQNFLVPTELTKYQQKQKFIKKC